ncbi:hypothetical protein OKJ48_29315 [Streptomyces kunmingensis]|uniref:Uncharacterized protein n=1 Tax=Streptomyces kunmingensis TaxID=68225 RepID=A0ABU6CHU6_9ACTN|nr:hypothetical protein [Streptomyces kunmingensis]MEB3964303.1 hypothetical protein [Streptomyces kunmingensis]
MSVDRPTSSGATPTPGALGGIPGLCDETLLLLLPQLASVVVESVDVAGDMLVITAHTLIQGRGP